MLVRIAGRNDNSVSFRELAQRRDSSKTHRSSADHRNSAAIRNIASQHCVNTRSCGLDHHGSFVRQLICDFM
jgi:hypothetical protein